VSDLFQSVEPPQNSITTNPSDSVAVAENPSQSSLFLSPQLKAQEVLAQIKWVATHRKTEYLADLVALFSHKSVAVRRRIAETIAVVGNKEIIAQLEELKAQEADRQTWLLIETTIDKLNRGNDLSSQSAQVLSVSEAVKYLKKIVSEKTFTIEGELSEVRLFQRSYQDIYYLGLKDNQDSRIDCMLLSSTAYRAGFPINDGMMVRVTGKFKLGKQSKLYFEIQHIQLTGEGELLRNLKLLEEKLRLEGLFDESRKRTIPSIPKHVLLLASPNSAAIKDFTNVLAHRRGGVEVFHLPIKTQGVGAEFEILRALEKTNELCDQYNIDTVVMTRGGGSQDDLFVFNSEHIVRALFAINRPTIVAIGHERDITLSELVADLRCSTPSQAAEKVSLSKQEIIAVASSSIQHISSLIQTRKHQYEVANNQLFFNVTRLVQQQLSSARLLCKQTDGVITELIHSVKVNITNTLHTIEAIVNRKVQTAHIFVRSYPHFLNQIQQKTQLYQQENKFYLRVITSTTFEQFRTFQHRFKTVSQDIELQDPQRVLEQGYAMVLQNNELISKRTELHSNQPTTLRFADGEVTLNQM